MTQHQDYIPSQDEIDWYRKHPDQLERYADSEQNYMRYLVFAFAVGVACTIVAKMIEVFAPESWYEIFAFIADFLYSLGVSIWGAVVAIYMLEIAYERRQRMNRAWYDAIKREISEQEDQD